MSLALTTYKHLIFFLLAVSYKLLLSAADGTDGMDGTNGTLIKCSLKTLVTAAVAVQ
jgi:hypothetical protein